VSGFAVLALVLLSGLHGIVTRGPTAPVCKAGVACSAPAVGAVLVFSRAGRMVLRVRTGAGGRYSVHLTPGYYTVEISPEPRIGFGIRPAQVHVRRNVDAHLDFSIDTGIR
jgi:hypothetical protein